MLKKTLCVWLVTFMIIPSTTVLALPKVQGNIPTGVSVDSSTPGKMVINAPNKAIINYTSFDIAGGEQVQFIQPGAQSVVLNRVNSAAPTQINGLLGANGRVFVVNPNGVVFGAGSVVDTASLVVSGHNITDADFLAGNYVFSGGNGDVVNNGILRADGCVALIGKRVYNRGTIDAGSVGLGAGNSVTVNLGGDNLVGFIVGSDSAFVQNSGTIKSSGNVVLSAARVQEVVDAVVNNPGVIEATGAVSANGTIRLVASNGAVSSAGDLKAANGNVVVNAATADIAGGVDVDGFAANADSVEISGVVKVAGDYTNTSSLNISSSGSLTVLGTLDNTAGSMNIAQGRLGVKNFKVGTSTFQGNTQVSVYGDWTDVTSFDSGFSSVSFVPGYGKTSVVDMDSSVGSFYDLNLNSFGGTFNVTDGNNLSVANNLNVAGRMDMVFNQGSLNVAGKAQVKGNVTFGNVSSNISLLELTGGMGARFTQGGLGQIGTLTLGRSTAFANSSGTLNVDNVKNLGGRLTNNAVLNISDRLENHYSSAFGNGTQGRLENSGTLTVGSSQQAYSGYIENKGSIISNTGEFKFYGDFINETIEKSPGYFAVAELANAASARFENLVSGGIESVSRNWGGKILNSGFMKLAQLANEANAGVDAQFYNLSGSELEASSVLNSGSYLQNRGNMLVSGTGTNTQQARFVAESGITRFDGDFVNGLNSAAQLQLGDTAVLSLGGSFNNSQGTMTGTGTVKVAGTGTQNINFGNAVLNNLEVNSTGTVKMLSNTVVNGDFVLQQGRFESDPNQFTFNVGGNVSLNPDGFFVRFANMADADAGSVENPFQINDIYGLQSIFGGLDYSYVLTADINAADTLGLLGGFTPVGTEASAFTGNFNGNNFSITGLNINATHARIGLFGAVRDAEIKDVVLKDFTMVSTLDNVGALAGWGVSTDIHNVTVENANIVSGNENGFGAGGIIGYGYSVRIYDSLVDGTISGGNGVGGIAGMLQHSRIWGSDFDGVVSSSCDYAGGAIGWGENVDLRDSFSVAQVSGRRHVGGFAGYLGNSFARICGANAQVTGFGTSPQYHNASISFGDFAGGFAGSLGSTYVSQSYAEGSVTSAGWFVGGFVGEMYVLDADTRCNIENSYSLADVFGADGVGGFVGHTRIPEGSRETCSVSHCYSAGSVGSDNSAGGFTGGGDGEFEACYWDTEAAGIAVGDEIPGIYGRTTAQMKDKNTFEGWNFTNNTWDIVDNPLKFIWMPNQCGDDWFTMIDKLASYYPGNAIVDEILLDGYARPAGGWSANTMFYGPVAHPDYDGLVDYIFGHALNGIANIPGIDNEKVIGIGETSGWGEGDGVGQGEYFEALFKYAADKGMSYVYIFDIDKSWSERDFSVKEDGFTALANLSLPTPGNESEGNPALYLFRYDPATGGVDDAAGINNNLALYAQKGITVGGAFRFEEWNDDKPLVFKTDLANAAAAHGMNLQTKIEPWIAGVNNDTTAFDKVSSAAGLDPVYETQWRQYVSDALDWAAANPGLDVKISIGHEFNVDDSVGFSWYPWQNNPAAYVQMYKNLHSVAQEVAIQKGTPSSLPYFSWHNPFGGVSAAAGPVAVSAPQVLLAQAAPLVSASVPQLPAAVLNERVSSNSDVLSLITKPKEVVAGKRSLITAALPAISGRTAAVPAPVLPASSAPVPGAYVAVDPMGLINVDSGMMEAPMSDGHILLGSVVDEKQSVSVG